MAKKTITITELTDDLDGTSKADRTIAFSYEGTSYEIDLTKKNATAFEKSLKTYVDHARKVSTRRTRFKATSSPRASRKDLAAIRTWAQENGYTISDRGRIPTQVIEAYDSAS